MLTLFHMYDLSHSHCFELVNGVYVGWCDICFVMIDDTVDEFGTVMCLETTDYSLVVGLHMCCEVWGEILDVNVGKVIRNYVPQEVVL